MVLLTTLPDHIANGLKDDEIYVLPTLRLKVLANKESECIRGLLAWASDYSILSEKCRKDFNLPLFREEVPSIYNVSGYLMEVWGHSQITISAHFDEERSETFDVLVTRMIKAPVYSSKVHPTVRENLSGLELADPIFDQHVQLDLIIGMPIIRRLAQPGIRGVYGPTCYALNTIMGWVVMGKAPTESERVVPAQQPLVYLY